jgi:hypothetical protein
MNTGIVAFTGYNTRAVVAFCRFLKLRGLQAHLIARDVADPIFLTDFRDWVFLIRDSADMQIAKCLEYFSAVKNDISCANLLVLPTSEYLNRFFLAHRPEIRQVGVDIPLVDIRLYRDISDKYSFRTICRSNGLNTPKALAGGEKSFPFVAKKTSYESGSGLRAKPYLIFNDADYQVFCRDEPAGGFFFEEYVSGDSHYLLYHISKSGSVLGYSQKNLIQQADGKSIIAACSSDAHTCAIGEQYANLLVSLGFHGLVMIEVRKSSGQYFMIEANPRFWGPLQFVVDNYPGLLEQFLRDQGIQFASSGPAGTLTRMTPKGYFWYGGYVGDKLANRKPSFHGYSQEMMDDELHHWLASDVFLQEDTVRLFRAEIAGKMAT